VKEVSFQKCNHLRNPLNENKEVRISRDGQEVPGDIAYQLCKIIDTGDEYDRTCENLTMRGGPNASHNSHQPRDARYNRGEVRFPVTLDSLYSC
jgi:hypothetical protein